ncbi:hypothetical protein BH09MYX1_BH09MYX1_46900 [soil metagenome]
MKTEASVSALLAEGGRTRETRLTGPALLGRMKKLHQTLGGASVLKKVRSLRADLEPRERAALGTEIEKGRDFFIALSREVRGR